MPSKKGKSERIRKLPWKQATDPETGRNICRHWDCENPVAKRRRSWCGDECQHDAYMQSQPQYQKDQVEKRDKEVCCDCGLDCRKVQKELVRLKGLTTYVRFTRKVEKKFGIDCDVRSIIDWVDLQEAVECRKDAIKRNEEKQKEWDAKSVEERGRVPRPRTIPPLHESSHNGWRYDLPKNVNRDQAKEIARLMTRATRLYAGILRARKAALYAAGFDKGRVTLWDMDHIVEIVNGGSYKLENLATRCQPCHKKKTAQLAADRALERKGILELDFNQKDQ